MLRRQSDENARRAVQQESEKLEGLVQIALDRAHVAHRQTIKSAVAA